MNFKETSDFLKDFKKLHKKYKSLPTDLSEFKKVVTAFPLGAGKHAAILQMQGFIKIIKARFFCRYLDKAPLRIIYAYHAKAKEIEFIEFIELYSKSYKDREDQKRIQDYLQSM